MKIKHARKISDLQNHLIQMERSRIQNMLPMNNNSTRGNHNPWQRRNPPSDQRPPTRLEPANVVDEPIPFCRPCESFHEESTCAFVKRILEES